MPETHAKDALLQVRNLTKKFQTQRGTVHAVSDVSFDIPRGSITGLVGESGSGKTTLGRALLRLIEPTSGQTSFGGADINGLDDYGLRSMRKRMQIIFQDPVSSLNPRLKVGDIIAEGLVAHRVGNAAERREKVLSLLQEVGMRPDAANRYPHEFSGGQRQRIGIARALALDPEFIVADECVSALDVSIQAQILNLLLDLRAKRNLTMLFIAHDLSAVEYLCDQIIVMYLGRIVEAGPSSPLYRKPRHPYSQALLSAIPHPDPRAPRNRRVLSDDIPSPLAPPSGCVFRTRCRLADGACAEIKPDPVTVGVNHLSYCLKTGATA